MGVVKDDRQLGITEETGLWLFVVRVQIRTLPCFKGWREYLTCFSDRGRDRGYSRGIK